MKKVRQHKEPEGCFNSYEQSDRGVPIKQQPRSSELQLVYWVQTTEGS